MFSDNHELGKGALPRFYERRIKPFSYSQQRNARKVPDFDEALTADQTKTGLPCRQQPIPLMITDTNKTISFQWLHRCWWSSASRWSLESEPGSKATRKSAVSSWEPLFKDAHNTRSSHKQHRCSWSSLSSWSVESEPGDTGTMESPHFHALLCSQTLTTLDLSFNNIGADGARHLSEALTEPGETVD